MTFWSLSTIKPKWGTYTLAGGSGVFYTLFLISILAVAFNVLPVEANPKVITVPDEYFSIQEAINNSRQGDTIFVKSGIYFEHIVVNKNSLKLVGENRDTTIIDGNGTGIAIYVDANNTVLSDFTVKNSGGNLTDSGIYLNHSFNTSISNNKVSNNNLGVYLSSSPNSILRKNNMTGNQYNFGVSGHSSRIHSRHRCFKYCGWKTRYLLG